MFFLEKFVKKKNKSKKILHDINALTNQIDKFEYISFDVFDTLLIRPYLEPKDVFRYIDTIIEKDLQSERDKQQNIIRRTRFSEFRIQAEKEAKTEVRENTPEIEDMTLDDIYEYFVKKYGEEWRKYKQLEIDLETQTLQANPEMMKIYKYAVDSGKKIIINSDMYLNKDILENILKLKGYDKYDKLYVSSDTKKLKSTGNQYDYICQDLNISGEQILHIGDNQKVDYDMAIEKCWNAYLYKKPADQFFENELNEKFLKLKEQNPYNIYISIVLGLIILRWINNKVNGTENYWQDFGFNIGGYLCYSYTKWILDKSREYNLSDLMFVARDGYVLQKIYDLIKNKNDAKSHYVYANRALKIKCLPDVKNAKKEMRLDVLINYLVEEDEEFKEKSLENGFVDLATKTIDEKKQFLLDNIDIVNRIANKNMLQYKEYIQAITYKGFRKGIIDTGCGEFSAQKLIENALEESVYGFYILKWQQTSSNIGFKQKHECFFKYTKDLHYYSLIETIMTSPEQSVIAIKDKKPVYQQCDDELFVNRSEIVNKIHNGVLEFTSLFFNVFDGFIIDIAKEYSIKETLNVFTKYLNSKDICEAKKLLFSMDAIESNSSLYDDFLVKGII